MNDLELLEQAKSGNEDAFNALLRKHRVRLTQMVKLRMNRKLQGRLDASDIIQESFIEASRVFKTYSENPTIPVYLWLRHLAGEKLIQAHRKHLGTQKRAADREQPMFAGVPVADSNTLADELACSMTSPSQAAVRNEASEKLHQALADMSDLDREILTLKHFEHLTNRETAELLGMNYEAVKKRHVRALEKLQKRLAP